MTIRDITGATVGQVEEAPRLARAFISSLDTTNMTSVATKLQSLSQMAVDRIRLREQYANGEITLDDAMARQRAITDNVRQLIGGTAKDTRPGTLSPKAQAALNVLKERGVVP